MLVTQSNNLAFPGSDKTQTIQYFWNSISPLRIFLLLWWTVHWNVSSDILLHSEISALPSHPAEKLPLVGCLHQIPPFWAQGKLRKRRSKGCKSQRGWGIPKIQALLNQHDQNANEQIHKDWHKIHTACMSLHRVFCVCIMASVLVFLWDSRVRKEVSLCSLCLLLGSFPYFVLSKSDMLVSLLYYINL